MIQALSIAASGMRAGSLRLEAVAANTANPTSPTSVEVVQSTLPGGGVAADLRGTSHAADMISDVTNMVLAKQQFSSSVQIANVTSDMIKKLFEL